jgi:hypothetical protein
MSFPIFGSKPSSQNGSLSHPVGPLSHSSETSALVILSASVNLPLGHQDIMVPSLPLLIQQQICKYASMQLAKPCPTATNIVCDGIQLYYCWSHEASGYANNTSSTCVNRKSGNIALATLSNQQGGVYIHIPRQKPPSLLQFTILDVPLLLTQSMTCLMMTPDNGGSLCLENSN